MPQLDGLRALAVAFVMYDHWAPPKYNVESNLGISLGALGVHLFFVLSGFLISAILLGCRHQARVDDRVSLAPLGRFYARRFLRIFPAYYTLLAILFVFDIEALWQQLFEGVVLLLAVSIGSARLFQIRNRLDLFG